MKPGIVDPYDVITKEQWEDKEGRESFYQLLLYMAFSLLNSIVDIDGNVIDEQIFR